MQRKKTDFFYCVIRRLCLEKKDEVKDWNNWGKVPPSTYKTLVFNNNFGFAEKNSRFVFLQARQIIGSISSKRERIEQKKIVFQDLSAIKIRGWSEW